MKGKIALLVASLLVALSLVEVCVRVFDIGAIEMRGHIGMRKFFSAADAPLFYTSLRIRTDGASYVEVERGTPRVPSSFTTQRYSIAKPKGVFRVVCVGDSVTEEWAMDGFINYTDFLQRTLTAELAPTHPGLRVEVIPIGVGGYNAAQEVRYFERFFGRLDADVLLQQFCPNDADLIECPRCDPHVESTGNKDVDALDVLEIRRYLATPSGFSSALLARARDRVRFMKTKEPRMSHGVKLLPIGHGFVDAYAEMKRYTAARGLPYRVIEFPQLLDNDDQPELAYAKSTMSALGIRALDLLPGLSRDQKLTSLAFFPGDTYHPTESGHAIVAKLIAAYLKKEHLLP